MIVGLKFALWKCMVVIMYWLMAMEYISHRFPNIYISPLLNPLTKMPIFTRYWLWAARRLPLEEQELIILTSPLFFVGCKWLILLCANHLCIVLVNVFVSIYLGFVVFYWFMAFDQVFVPSDSIYQQ